MIRRRLLAAIGLALAIALLGATSWAWSARRADRAKLEDTRSELHRLAVVVQRAREGSAPPLPGCEGTGADPTGLEPLVDYLNAAEERLRARAVAGSARITWRVRRGWRGLEVSGGFSRHDTTIGELDAWGHPLLYRCPGALHPDGWEIRSSGPNGVDEAGAGDDLVVVGAAR